MDKENDKVKDLYQHTSFFDLKNAKNGFTENTVLS